MDNGYSPPFTYADPADPGSNFREYLDNSMNWMLAAGVEVTNDLGQIDVTTFDGSVAPCDVNDDGEVDLIDGASFFACLTGPNVSPAPDAPMTTIECLEAFDAERDGDVDMGDFQEFVARFGT